MDRERAEGPRANRSCCIFKSPGVLCSADRGAVLVHGASRALEPLLRDRGFSRVSYLPARRVGGLVKQDDWDQLIVLLDAKRLAIRLRVDDCL